MGLKLVVVCPGGAVTGGPEAMHQLLLEFANGSSFEDGIFSQLGRTLGDLNLALADHLVHVFAEGH